MGYFKASNRYCFFDSEPREARVTNKKHCSRVSPDLDKSAQHNSTRFSCSDVALGKVICLDIANSDASATAFEIIPTPNKVEVLAAIGITFREAFHLQKVALHSNTCDQPMI